VRTSRTVVRFNTTFPQCNQFWRVLSLLASPEQVFGPSFGPRFVDVLVSSPRLSLKRHLVLGLLVLGFAAALCCVANHLKLLAFCDFEVTVLTLCAVVSRFTCESLCMCILCVLSVELREIPCWHHRTGCILLCTGAILVPPLCVA